MPRGFYFLGSGIFKGLGVSVKVFFIMSIQEKYNFEVEYFFGNVLLVFFC